MSVSTGQAKIKRAMKELLARWDVTRSSWRDDVSRKFEENHLAPLRARLKATEGAMGHMDALLNRIRQDCE